MNVVARGPHTVWDLVDFNGETGVKAERGSCVMLLFTMGSVVL